MESPRLAGDIRLEAGVVGALMLVGYTVEREEPRVKLTESFGFLSTCETTQPIWLEQCAEILPAPVPIQVKWYIANFEPEFHSRGLAFGQRPG